MTIRQLPALRCGCSTPVLHPDCPKSGPTGKCANAEDARLGLRFAREHRLEVAVRGAGHNIAGNALCDDGLMIDLSGMRAVEVDPDSRRAWVQPGATLADLDVATQAHGLATPVGINSTTDIAGLTLGGGFGWLTRQHGMTVDNLLSVDVITAAGALLRASVDDNPDLFWGLRGGGGNFGIVTQFEFRLHPVGPEIHAGLVIYPLEQGAEVLRAYRDFVRTAPESLSVWAVVRHAPPLPFLPAAVQGSKVVVLAIACTAPAEQCDALVAPLLQLGNPIGSHIGRQSYARWQQAFDPLLTPGARNYWKSHNFSALGDEVLDAMVTFGKRLPTADCEIFVAHVGGAPNRVRPDATAYAQRDAHFVMNVHGRWHAADEDADGIAWARDVFAASGRARTVANRLLASLTAVSAILLLAPVPPEATAVTAAGIIARGAERETGRAENSVRERHAGGYHPDPFTYGCRTPCD